METSTAFHSQPTVFPDRRGGRWGFSGDIKGDFVQTLNGREREKGELFERSEFSPFRGKPFRACQNSALYGSEPPTAGLTILLSFSLDRG